MVFMIEAELDSNRLMPKKQRRDILKFIILLMKNIS